jgi:hypothetical protein
MKIQYLTSKEKVIPVFQPAFNMIVSKLENESFAEECQIDICEFGRFVIFSFRLGDKNLYTFRFKSANLIYLLDDLAYIRKRVLGDPGPSW